MCVALPLKKQSVALKNTALSTKPEGRHGTQFLMLQNTGVVPKYNLSL